MAESEQDKSEPATEFKLKKSRERGSVARGMDLGFLAGLGAFAAYSWIAGPSLAADVAEAARGALTTAPQVVGGSHEIMTVTGLVMGHVGRGLILMGGTIFLTVLLFELLQTGVVFTAFPLKPDFTRLNPATGFKRVFSVRMLIETLKNVLKLSGYGLVAYLVIASSLRATAPAVQDGRSLLEAMNGSAFRLIAWSLVAAAAFALLDQVVARRDFRKKMRMSRSEVRREMRDREGEPRIKHRRKQLHGEFVKASESLRNVKGADVLVTNPTHIAVALRYDGARMAAPTVVAKGAMDFALRMKRLALLHGVIIVEDKPLARELFRHAALNREIPEASYAAVAKIYRALRPSPPPQNEADSNVH